MTAFRTLHQVRGNQLPIVIYHLSDMQRIAQDTMQSFSKPAVYRYSAPILVFHVHQ